MTHCCAECGGVEGEGISLKACKSCMLVNYCNANCQRNHWPKHKKECKERAAELRDEALFKDPPPKEDCPICFLPMPGKLIACISLPLATISSIPIAEYAIANKELALETTEVYHPCCGKSICGGCIYSFRKSGNYAHCPFCNERTSGKTNEEVVQQMMKRVEANDAGATYALGNYYYYQGHSGLQQDQANAMELWKQSAELGWIQAHYQLGSIYRDSCDWKKSKVHWEVAAMAGDEGARCNIGVIEYESGKMERAVKHWTIAASAGHHKAMNALQIAFYQGRVSKESMDLTLTAYNNSCAEMRSEARDAYIQMTADRIGGR